MPSTRSDAARGARWALGVLLLVNLFNYLDRQVLYSLLPLIQSGLSLNDAQAGRLASAFMIVYMFAAPPIGCLADRSGARKRWISAGVFLWSLATAASGLAGSYPSLLCARAAVGIGECFYGTISPSFVAEPFPADRRAWVLALFSMAIPVGSALGYIAGGAVGQRFGWRPAFFIVGVPGLLLSALCLTMQEPRREIPAGPMPGLLDYPRLFRIPSFSLVTLAGAAMTFALGGYAVWMPSYLHRAWGLSVGQAGTYFGAITVVSGIVGSLVGGWLADALLRWTSRAHFLVSAVGLLAGMPLAMAAVNVHSFSAAVGLLLAAEFFLFLNMGPLNAVIVSVTPVSERSMAFAANIFVIHALGDAVSPWIIGAWSDRVGLRAALLLASLALGAAGGFCIWGMRHYDDDSRKAA